MEVANKNENEGDERKTVRKAKMLRNPTNIISFVFKSYFRIISNKRGAIENEACYEAAVHHFTRKCPRVRTKFRL